MTYTDLLSRIGIVKTNLAADVSAVKGQGFIGVSGRQVFR